MTRVAALSFAAILVLTLFLPVVAADHSYSHRYIIYGRVVDANGDPVPNLTVNMGLDPTWASAAAGFEGPCTGAQPNIATDAFGDTITRPKTNEYGEFIFCYHKHSMSRLLPGTSIVRIDEANWTSNIDFDPYFRTQFVGIQLPVVRADANKAILDTSFTVLGRLWESSFKEVVLDGNTVFGLTLNLRPVLVTYHFDDGTTASKNTTTNNYGDFALRFPITKRPTGGTVTIESEGYSKTVPIDAKMGVAAIKADVPKGLDPFVRNLLIGLGVLAAVAVVGGFGWYGVRKMNAKREAQQDRARSTRKRANR